MDEPRRPLPVEDVRPFVPAEDFAVSRRFYEALGWSMVWTDDEGLAMMELGGHRFMLQDHYVRDWAENFMITVVVDDAAVWYRHVISVLTDGDYGGARVAEPRREEWGATVTYVWDPCGVLLHFTQWHDR